MGPAADRDLVLFPTPGCGGGSLRPTPRGGSRAGAEVGAEHRAGARTGCGDRRDLSIGHTQQTAQEHDERCWLAGASSQPLALLDAQLTPPTQPSLEAQLPAALLQAQRPGAPTPRAQRRARTQPSRTQVRGIFCRRRDGKTPSYNCEASMGNFVMATGYRATLERAVNDHILLIQVASGIGTGGP